MTQMRLTACAILLAMLAYSLGFAIIAIRKKLREIDDEMGLPQRID